MNVALGEKFGAFFLSRCHVGPDIPQEDQIAPRTWVSRRLGIEVAEHWETWIGSLQTERMTEDGLAIYVTIPAAQPTLIDEDNNTVYRRAFGLLNGLLLQGIPWYDGGVLVHGANIDGVVQLRGWDTVERHYLTSGLDVIVRMADVRRALVLADQIRAIEGALPDWMRFHRGIESLLRANKESNAVGNRLHQLVRALESVLKPRIGSSKNNFAHRGQTFATNNQTTRDVLLEIYDLRSHVEHLNVPTDGLPPGGTEEERRELVNRRTRQADILASTVLLRILETPALLEEFRTDNKIDAFWQIPDGERIRLWGNQLDIVGIP